MFFCVGGSRVSSGTQPDPHILNSSDLPASASQMSATAGPGCSLHFSRLNALVDLCVEQWYVPSVLVPPVMCSCGLSS